MGSKQGERKNPTPFWNDFHIDFCTAPSQSNFYIPRCSFVPIFILLQLRTTRRSRVKISANQSTLLSVLFFNLLFWRWLEAIHHAFHYVNLSNICGKQAFLFINLSNVSFFIVIQSVRILMSFWQKPITSTVSIAKNSTDPYAFARIDWDRLDPDHEWKYFLKRLENRGNCIRS